MYPVGKTAKTSLPSGGALTATTCSDVNVNYLITESEVVTGKSQTEALP